MAKFENMNIEQVVAKINEYFNIHAANEHFTATDIGLAGSQLTTLVNAKLIRIVNTTPAWYQVDEDTMKRRYVNVYKCEYAPKEVVARIVNERMATLNEKVSNAKWVASNTASNLRNLADQMDALQRYL